MTVVVRSPSPARSIHTSTVARRPSPLSDCARLDDGLLAHREERSVPVGEGADRDGDVEGVDQRVDGADRLERFRTVMYTASIGSSTPAARAEEHRADPGAAAAQLVGRQDSQCALDQRDDPGRPPLPAAGQLQDAERAIDPVEQGGLLGLRHHHSGGPADAAALTSSHRCSGSPLTRT